MKSVCMIASDNVVISGDVVFINEDKFGSDIVVYLPQSVKNFRVDEKGLIVFSQGKCPEKNFKLKLLWFWHMFILNKSHVYLTGVLR